MDAIGSLNEAGLGQTLGRYIWLLWVIWLAFLAYPLQALFQAHPSPVRVAVVLTLTAIFAGVYTWNIIHALRRLRLGTGDYTPWPAIAVMLAIALGLTLGDRHAWVEIFIFVVVSLGPSLPPRHALIGIGLFIVAAPVLGVLISAGPVQIGQMVFQSAVSGIAVIIVGRVIVLDRELREAQEEIARLAVNEERLRFARDLHDLLGHSLSLIALKSELVGKLIPIAPERALAENHDVEAVARRALGEVREAVAGYRQPSLASELENAREILTAAGIRLECEGEAGGLPPAQEAVLAWAVREGVTNVIRHSRATRCTIRIRRDGNDTTVEVTDDGIGAGAEVPAGSGVRGLAERAAALGGRCEDGVLPEGGFRLAVILPVGTA
ncbi:MAG TPA: sensor histidine kinase [Chloroflexota bacterium]|nr:sensor histidine kinase [Chloroflexota bacterium]